MVLVHLPFPSVSAGHLFAADDVFLPLSPSTRAPFRGSLLSSLSHSSEPFSQLQKVS